MDRGKVVAAALVTAFGLLVLLWSTGTGTPLVRPPQGSGGAPAVPPPAPPPDPVEVTDVFTAEPPRESTLDVPWEAILIGLVLLAVLIRLLRWLLARDWEPEEVDISDEADEVALLLEATSEERRLRFLREGDARNAVVACWVSLEEAATRGGLARDPAETPAELTVRVLDAWAVPPEVVGRLADLYREARFSRHPVTEEMRLRAVQALESVHEVVSQRVDA